ncbi:MAG TPA: TadE/TadG family type IV pilus assembly protein [Thermoleophilaceae bacterium]|nr:TadE/TadG family type IV pilus assembly protein [Thermoleophilaceae bacterium]
MAKRLAGERGQASVELLGMLPLLLLGALLVWQLLLAGYTVTSAENAARNASRAEGLGQDGERAARESLSFGLERRAQVEIEGDRATVQVRIPIVAPGIDSEDLTVSRDAELPSD